MDDLYCIIDPILTFKSIITDAYMQNLQYDMTPMISNIGLVFLFIFWHAKYW